MTQDYFDGVSANGEKKSLVQRLSFNEFFDRSFKPARRVAHAQAQRFRAKYPNLSDDALAAKLEARYLNAATSTGAAIGGAAALPGVGTLTALAAAFGETGAFIAATSVYVLTAAELRGIELTDEEQERALVLTVLAGGSASEAVQKVMRREGGKWGKEMISKIPSSTLKSINSALSRRLIARFGAKQGATVLGKIVPFGIGAVLGGGLNRAAAKAIIEATRDTLH